jgi:hypothetical protein
MTLPIKDYALIGDCRTATLIGMGTGRSRRPIPCDVFIAATVRILSSSTLSSRRIRGSAK